MLKILNMFIPKKPVTKIERGIKYRQVENGWAPILNVPTIHLIDSSKTSREKKSLH